MTLSRRFHLLIAGLTAAPLILAVMVFGVSYALSLDTVTAARASAIYHWIEKVLVPAAVRNEQPSAPPRGAWAIVIDDDGTVTYSTLPRFPAGIRLDADNPDTHEQVGHAIAEYADRDLEHGIALRLVRAEDGEIVRIVHSNVSIPPIPLLFTRRVAIVSGIFLLVLVLGSLIGTVIIRTLRDRLAKLSGDIHRIAAGDLDKEIGATPDDEFGSLANDLDRMRRALKDDRERRSRFLMAVSHDLGTPLTTIRGYLEAIEDGVVSNPEQIVEAASTMQAKTILLEERISELIDFVRLETGEWRLTLERLVLADYLESLAAEYVRDAAAVGRTFSHRIELGTKRACRADRRLMNRVFENLVHNALRYTEPGGSVQLSALHDPAASAAIITVKDDGPGFGGIDPTELFEPFRRGTNARNERGFGLGLATVRSVLDAHGFSITAHEGAGGGARFEIRIPDSTADRSGGTVANG